MNYSGITVLLIALIGLCPLWVFGQEEVLPSAVLVDEFNLRGGCEDGFARMDNFFNELSNNPGDTGVILVLGDSGHMRRTHIREVQFFNYINFRRFDRSRIEMFKGTTAGEGVAQLWRVPLGASQPEAEGKIAVTGSFRLPDEPAAGDLLYSIDHSEGVPGCGEYLFNLKEFSNALKAYPAYSAKIVIPESTTAKYRKKAREITAELAGYGIPKAKIATVYKKVRPNRMLENTELWFVPPTAPTSSK